MDHLTLTKAPIMKTGMLIRKPVAQVFEAFVNPDLTTRFWFTKSSGKLEPGKQVQWRGSPCSSQASRRIWSTRSA